MDNNIKRILALNVEDTEFDEENIGVITIELFRTLMIGLEINSIENGKSKVWINSQQAQEIILAFRNAIEAIVDKQIKFESEEVKHINTLTVKDIKFEIKNDGIVIIEVYNKERIGICISLTKGADPELWLDVSNAELIVKYLEIAMKHIL